MTLLVTGAAGFIGFHACEQLLKQSPDQLLIGIDNLNEYYDPKLKAARLELLSKYPNFKFKKINICDKNQMKCLFEENAIKKIIHLAAQAGVRYAFENPDSYIQSNLVGFSIILEMARHYHVEHLVFASSSSVYGANEVQPFSEKHATAHPISLYAATKKSNEMMAHSYADLYQIPCTGLRFFTVYGPWGRPDMALFKFTKAILEDTPIDVYNHGQMIRDFTYVDDIVNAVTKILKKPPQPNTDWDPLNPEPSYSRAPYRIVNIGNHNPVQLLDFIVAIEKAIGKTALKNLMPLQPGDVPNTYADIEILQTEYGCKPEVSIEVGVKNFVDWYRMFYAI